MKSTADRFERQLRRSRVALYSIGLPVLALTIAGAAESFLRILYILLGFSLIIFLHELGHFVVARACSVKCLAFSLGIGPRMFGWRKGGKVTFGNDPYDPEAKKAAAADKLESAEAATTHSDLPQTAVAPAHPAAVGDCDYRLSWLPLGGYVRMLGQDDMDPTKVSTDPHAFNQRPIWQRMCIVSAGVIMNLIFAAVCFSIIFSPGIGVDFPRAVLGPVAVGSPAAAAGLKMGDEVISIDGKKPRGFVEFADLQMAGALSNGTDPIQFEVRPYGTHGEANKTVSIVPTRVEGQNFLAIGVEQLPSLKLGGDAKDYVMEEKGKEAEQVKQLLLYEKNKAELAKIRKGDVIVGVDGKDVRDDYISLYRYVQTKNGEAVKLTVENKNKALPAQDITLYPHVERVIGMNDFPTVLGLSPRLVLGEPMAGYPAAAAGLKENDVVKRAGDRSNPNISQFKEIVENSKGSPVTLVVERDGKELTIPVTAKFANGKWLLGTLLEQDQMDLAVAPAVEGLQLPAGAKITALDGKEVKTWPEVYTYLRSKTAGTTVAVTFAGTGSDGKAAEAVTRTLPLSAEEAAGLQSKIHYQLGLRLENKTETQSAHDAWEAVLMGGDHTKKFVLQVYMTLAGLFRRTISPNNLHGIVGITKIGYDVQERGPVWLWYVLAMVSVNLAVANFLPLPIVDGGLFLLLILEKIRGKPLPLKVQSAIQVVGIVLLAGLFLFVTYNDIGLFRK